MGRNRQPRYRLNPPSKPLSEICSGDPITMGEARALALNGRLVNNADIIQAIAAERGFTVASRLDRVISSSRKSFNLSHANIKTETVLVLQKSDG